MSKLARVSFSIEENLLAQFEEMFKTSTYANRSEFVRDMIRNEMVARECKDDGPVLGTITFVYDHHSRGVNDSLVELQHAHLEHILASTHVHLDHDLCAEMVMVKGKASELRELTDKLRQHRGVFHAALAISSVAKSGGTHSHDHGGAHDHGHSHAGTGGIRVRIKRGKTKR